MNSSRELRSLSLVETEQSTRTAVCSSFREMVILVSAGRLLASGLRSLVILLPNPLRISGVSDLPVTAARPRRSFTVFRYLRWLCEYSHIFLSTRKKKHVAQTIFDIYYMLCRFGEFGRKLCLPISALKTRLDVNWI
jgi:hypothetical protein